MKRISKPRFSEAHAICRLAVVVAVLGSLSSALSQQAFAQQPADASAENTLAPARLTVATREVPPFAMRNEEGGWEGISIELVRRVVADLSAEQNTDIAIDFRDMPLDDMLDAVEAGTVDFAAAAITANYQRELRFDFSHPYYTSGLGIAVGSRQRKSGWSGVASAIFSPTFAKIVVGLFVAMLVSAIAIYLVERKHQASDFPRSFIKGVTAGLWWAAVTLTTVGYGDKVPKSSTGRLIATAWMFAGLFIVASFTAAVTSAMTVGRLQSYIAGPADLARVRIATIADSTSADYLKSRRIRFTAFPDVSNALEALTVGRIDAVVYDAPVLQHRILHDGNSDLYVLPTTFERQDYAIAMPSESTLREPMNRALLKETNNPDWAAVLDRYLGHATE